MTIISEINNFLFKIGQGLIRREGLYAGIYGSFGFKIFWMFFFENNILLVCLTCYDKLPQSLFQPAIINEAKFCDILGTRENTN